MSLLKAKINEQAVREQVLKEFSSVDGFSKVIGGELSQAFSFRAEGKDFIIRVNASDKGFRKDEFAFRHFSGPEVPIPEVISMGRLNNEFFFCITPKAPGVTLKDITPEQTMELMPCILNTVHAIHQTPIAEVPDSSLGGWSIGGPGKGMTWKQTMLSLDDDFLHWEELIGSTFLEEEVYRQARVRFEDLLEFCPEQRSLIHGDYGFDNVLTEHGRITAVIDWGCSRYGDFLLDVAYMCFWSTAIDYRDIFTRFYDSKGIRVEHYDERIRCYSYRTALVALGFFAKSGQKQAYDWVKDRLGKLPY